MYIDFVLRKLHFNIMLNVHPPLKPPDWNVFVFTTKEVVVRADLLIIIIITLYQYVKLVTFLIIN